MRIALIYTGHLRTWDKCRTNHEGNFTGHDFVSFWHTYEHPGNAPIFTAIPCEFYRDMNDHRFNTNKRPEASVANSLNQWHNMFIGFCLVPCDYDIYVRIRPDIMVGGIDFNQYDCKGNNVYIPEEKDYGGINDQFAFGSYEVMKKYYSVYLNHAALFDEGVTFHTETMMLKNLEKQGVNIVRIPITQYILRGQDWKPEIVI